MYKIYCDFDATITQEDVWNNLFQAFGKPEAFTIWEEFSAGRMRASECIRYAAGTVENLSIADADALFAKEKLRDGFIEFVEFCKIQGIELTIVSDGFSGYIERILRRCDIDLPVFTNTIDVGLQGKLTVDFPREREACQHCAACKCGAMLETSEDTDTLVYVGDGYSDVCPVRMSDVVFARDHLLKFCNKENIPHHPFSDFHGVRTILQNYLGDRPKYRREQAHRRRNELITLE